MQYGKIFRTVAHLRPTQVWHQILLRLHKPAFRLQSCPDTLGGHRGVGLTAPFIDKPQAVSGDTFTFLNLSRRFDHWNDTHYGMLWAYNLNYMDYLLQADVTAFDGKMWIDRFLRELPQRTIGLDPYPTALRLMNWAKFAAKHYAEKPLPEPWRDAYYAQLLHLERRREYHLLGNHLLEDAFGLFIGWLHLGERGHHLAAARSLMLRQLREQTLADGGHYEQSPMYHCILLDRMLDALNFARACHDEAAAPLQEIAQVWLGWLAAICWSDASLPLFGDSAVGIAPTPTELFDYARRLGLSWETGRLRESGYRTFADQRLELVADVGAVAATYQPGHTHSDVFSFELRIDGQPLVVDTGITTYEKNSRRQYERSYAAHNVAQIQHEEPFEVWGGFRVGRMARVSVTEETATHVRAQRKASFTAERYFSLNNGKLLISDNVFGHEAVARLHLAPQLAAEQLPGNIVKTTLATFHFQADELQVSIAPCQVSTQYNRPQTALCIEVHFRNTLSVAITPTTT